MPVHAIPYILSSGSSISLVNPRVALAVFVAFITLLIRRWAAGKDLIARLHIREQDEQKERQRQRQRRKDKGLDTLADDDTSHLVGKSPERDLHGMTFLVVCTISPSSLLVLSSLSNRGAQLILLLPKSSFTDDALSATLQYMQLLRDGTNNEQIFAEECDLLDLKSIDDFCKKWNEQQQQQQTQQEGSTPQDTLRESLPSSDGRSKQPRRVDGLVLLPYPLKEMYSRRRTLEQELLGKFHLINTLLSTLLLLPPERDIRILNWITPWYAAGVQQFLDEQKKAVRDQKEKKQGTGSAESQGNKASRKAEKRAKAQKASQQTANASEVEDDNTAPPPSLSMSSVGSTALTYLLLTFELQRRLILLAEADPRPRNPLPGILDNNQTKPKVSSVDALLPPSSTNKNYPNINVVNICPGFERDGEVAQWIWSTAHRSHPTPLSRIASAIQTILSTILFYPLLFIFPKSPKAAAEQFIWGMVAPLNVKSGTDSLLAEVDAFQTLAKEASATSDDQDHAADAATADQPLAWLQEPQESEVGWKGIQPGRLYREGAIVKLPLESDWYRRETLAELWADWENKVEAVTGGLRRAGGASVGEQ